MNYPALLDTLTIQVLISLSYFRVPIVVVLLAAPAIADESAIAVSIDVSELKFLAGSWEGHLEYLDYGDGKTRIRLPTTVQYEAAKDSIKYIDDLYRAEWFKD